MPGETTSIYVQDYARPTVEKQMHHHHTEPMPRSRQPSTYDVERNETATPSRTTSTVRRYYTPKLGNPTPLGLSAFALSVMLISFYDCQAFGIVLPNVAVGVSLFTGGIVQFAAGMWEFKVGNTFGGTGFSAFGGFWASFAVLYIDGFGIASAYGKDSEQYNNALAVFCLCWLIFTFIFTLACLRTNMVVLTSFVCLTGVFVLLTIYHFTQNDIFRNISGGLGIVTSCFVWYAFAATLLTPDLSPIQLPVWDLSRKS